jgi:hypothetical protein
MGWTMHQALRTTARASGLPAGEGLTDRFAFIHLKNPESKSALPAKKNDQGISLTIFLPSSRYLVWEPKKDFWFPLIIS